MSKYQMELGQHVFFKGLSESDLNLIAANAHLRTYEAGECMIREGEKADCFYLVLKGQVNIITDKLDSVEDSDPQPTPIQKLKAGEVLGWSWLVPPYEWRLDAKAATTVEAVAFDAKALRQKCEEDPRLGYELMKRLSRLMTERIMATRMNLAMHTSTPFSQIEGG